MTSGFALSPEIIAAVRPPSPQQDRLSAAASCSSILAPFSLSSRSKCAFSISRKNPKSTLRCDTSVRSSASVDADVSLLETEEDEKAKEKIGAKVRVTAPVKVYLKNKTLSFMLLRGLQYHVVRVPEVELMGTEGSIKDYVVLWKGKRISANLPFKVQFVKEIEGRGAVKFFAHLKEDEFELIES